MKVLKEASESENVEIRTSNKVTGLIMEGESIDHKLIDSHTTISVELAGHTVGASKFEVFGNLVENVLSVISFAVEDGRVVRLKIFLHPRNVGEGVYLSHIFHGTPEITFVIVAYSNGFGSIYGRATAYRKEKIRLKLTSELDSFTNFSVNRIRFDARKFTVRDSFFVEGCFYSVKES